MMALPHDTAWAGTSLLLNRYFANRVLAVLGIAHGRRAQVEPAVRDHAHRIQELAAEELHAHDAARGVARHVFLQQEQVLGQPVLGALGKERLQVREALDEHDARAASALLGLEKRGKRNFACARPDGLHVVEGPYPRRRHPEAAQERGLGGLGKLERKCVGAVQHAHAADLERAHVGERVRHRARVPAHVRGRACLVEVERCERRIGVGERSLLEVDRDVVDAAALQRLEERLLPLGMLEKDGEDSHERMLGLK
jgi:hypothetical protein